MTRSTDHLGWPDHLEQLVSGLQSFDRVVVLSETDSTQDAARREADGSGLVVLAGRQVSGRGRQGRAWADDRGEGISMTLVVPLEDPAFLCARAAVAVACTLVPRLEQVRIHAGVKWPNDLVMITEGIRKLAGILVEGHEQSALVGIGVNVLQQDWPPELAQTAGSLAGIGLPVTRLEIIEQLLLEWDRVQALSREELQLAYARHDMLTGAQATIEEDGARFSGIVRGIDPFSGIDLETSAGTTRIDPQRAHVIDWRLPDGLQMGR